MSELRKWVTIGDQSIWLSAQGDNICIQGTPASWNTTHGLTERDLGLSAGEIDKLADECARFWCETRAEIARRRDVVREARGFGRASVVACGAEFKRVESTPGATFYMCDEMILAHSSRHGTWRVLLSAHEWGIEEAWGGEEPVGQTDPESALAASPHMHVAPNGRLYMNRMMPFGGELGHQAYMLMMRGAEP